MLLSASELSIGYRHHLVGLGVDLALTAGEVLMRATRRTSPSECAVTEENAPLAGTRPGT